MFVTLLICCTVIPSGRERYCSTLTLLALQAFYQRWGLVFSGCLVENRFKMILNRSQRGSLGRGQDSKSRKNCLRQLGPVFGEEVLCFLVGLGSRSISSGGLAVVIVGPSCSGR